MLSRVTSAFSAIAVIAVAAMAVITLADVASRNILGLPIRGTFDFIELFLVIAVFFGLPEVFSRNNNIVVDVIDHFIDATTGRKVEKVSTIIVGLFLILLIYAMIMPGLDTVRFPEHKQETGIPTWVYWVPIFVGSFLSLIQLLRTALSRAPEA